MDSRRIYMQAPQLDNGGIARQCYLPSSLQNTVLAMSFRFSRVQPGAAWCLVGNAETGMMSPLPKDFRV